MQTLEQHPLFPTIAWTTVLLFAIFTAYLAWQLQATAASLSERKQEEINYLGNS
jgi:hypothetical protein